MAGRRRSDRALRVKCPLPGHPGVARREERRRFWALIAAGQQFAQMITAAAAQAAQALSNVKVNVSANPTVNANTGRTDTFARSPGTGRQ